MPESAYLYIFAAGLCILLLSSVFALIFGGNHKLNKMISYLSTVTASLFFIFISIYKLLFGFKDTLSFKLSSSFNFIDLHFTIDNLTSLFILLISFIALIVSIYSIGYVDAFKEKRNTGFLGAVFNLFVCSMLLVVTSGHLFIFLISWEIMFITSYFLIVYENEKAEVQKAGKVYLILTHFGTAFLTASFVMLYIYTGQAEIGMLDVSTIPASIKNLLFIFMLIGFGAKAGAIPLHVWLPNSYTYSPGNASAIISGVMSKTAIYGIVRFIIDMLAPEAVWWGLVMIITGALSVIFGICYALMEKNIKRLLAYSSIENIGIILIGLGLGVSASASGYSLIAALSITAAIFHTFNHSVFKCLLFLGAGSIQFATGTRDSEKLGGLIKKMPFTSVFFLIGSLSICSLPPFNGFVSEWLTYQAMLLNIAAAGHLMKLLILITAALLALAGALAVYTFVKVYGISFLALPRSEHSSNAVEVNKPMLASMGVLSVVCLLLGLFPMFFIKLLQPAIHDIYGIGIADNISGFSSFIKYPVVINNVSLSPLVILMLGLLVFAVIALLIVIFFNKSKSRKYGTWDCGYVGLDSRMQYSAAGFSKPARIVFRSIMKPQRELKVTQGKKPYFISAARYTVTTVSIFEKYLYEPIAKLITNFARKTRFVIQTGSIHTYLLYIFVTILLMFVYFILSAG